MTEVSDTALTPLSFLERSAMVFPDRSAIRYRERTVGYAEMADHATRLARALQAGGIQPGDRVAYLCPNLPEMLIAHFGVPLAGGVLVAINTRLAPEEIRYILEHSGARVLVGDTELLAPLTDVVADLRDGEGGVLEEVVAIVDDQADGVVVDLAFAATPYPDLLARGSDEPMPWTVDDEQRHDLDQLHVGDDRSAQRGHVLPPRRVPQRRRGADPQSSQSRERVPLDAPDVPLQRLVHDVGGDRARRHPCGTARRRPR